MSPVKEVRVIGLEALLKKLDPHHLLGDEVEGMVHRAAEIGQTRAMQRAPMLTGALESSIALTKSSMSAKFSTPLPYAKAIEGGRYFPSTGRRTKPRRFMGAGLGAARGSLKALITKAEAAIRARWDA